MHTCLVIRLLFQALMCFDFIKFTPPLQVSCLLRIITLFILWIPSLRIWNSNKAASHPIPSHSFPILFRSLAPPPPFFLVLHPPAITHRAKYRRRYLPIPVRSPPPPFLPRTLPLIQGDLWLDRI